MNMQACVLCFTTASLAVGSWSLPASAADPSHTVLFPKRTVVPAFTRARASGYRRPAYAGAPTGCSSTASGAFVGVAGANDYAGGTESAVVAGSLNEACDAESLIGGGSLNEIGDGGSAVQSLIGAGTENGITNADDFIGAGVFNIVSGLGSFIGAGDSLYGLRDEGAASAPGNQISGRDSFIGAGDLNSVAGSGSFIGAGGYTYAGTGAAQPGNQITGTDSFIGAGDQNGITGSEDFLGSGNGNSVAASQAVLGGGYGNNITSAASFSVIVGGNLNGASGEYESIGGGFDNRTSGADATIPGGNRNEADGELSFAAGYQAHALYTGSFVWSDFHSGSKPVSDTAAGQFVVRASGGTYFYSNEADTAGVKLAAGSGAWSNLSDRNAKTNIVPLDDDAILAKLVALPVSAWQYKTERGVTHLGPMAQDFYAAFRAGEDDRHITSIDEDGVALAAIKALNVKLERRDDRLRVENDRMQAELATLTEHNTKLERRVDALSARLP